MIRNTSNVATWQLASSVSYARGFRRVRFFVGRLANDVTGRGLILDSLLLPTLHVEGPAVCAFGRGRARQEGR